MADRLRTLRRLVPVALCLLSVLLLSSCGDLQAKGIWSAIAGTRQDDVWYIDQTLAYSTHDKVTTSRAVLKFVPGQGSVLNEEIRECLDLNGIVPKDLSYFVAFVSVDCRRELLHFSDMAFFDSEDNVIWRQQYEETYHIVPTADTSAGVISGYLCLNRPGFLDTLKKKKPFLYLFP
ncbi:MAG TPA: hypothetical protein PKN85_02290 [Syntrophorhabdaceae bacterium]|nr:hypothetical protein [Syntrophorhabdaceae bacterium]HOD75074.1 hypothetical protein [Syntrophorhabdaceae bacterium]